MDAKTILVVEDDDATREGFGIVLKQHRYLVALVRTGQDALQYLQTHDPPDLISLDMFMPGSTAGISSSYGTALAFRAGSHHHRSQNWQR